jgi:putative CocE/NonD family hydrolase
MQGQGMGRRSRRARLISRRAVLVFASRRAAMVFALITCAAAAAPGPAAAGSHRARRGAPSPKTRNSQPSPAASWSSYRYDRPARYGVVTETAIPITMPDGTVLRANVYRPDAPGRFPVLLFQNPYGSNGAQANTGGASDPFLVQRGYVQVVVDVRGTGQSQGTWDAFSPQEQRDGYDLVQWAAKQPWSDGKVGGGGGSYLAIDQVLTAALRPPHLKAIFPYAPLGDAYRDMVMTGGSVDTAFIPAWIANVGAGMIQPPPADPEGVASILSHITGVSTAASRLVVDPLTGGQLAYDGPFWQTKSPLDVAGRIRVPTFVVGGLHDIFQRGEPLLYEAIKQHTFARLLIGPWMHLTYFSGLPADGVPDLHHLELAWYDRWLLGINTHLESTPAVTQYQWGPGHYVTSRDWPNPRLRTQRLYLRGGGQASSAPPSTSEPTQSFMQNPATGICTLSSSQWTAGAGGYLPCESNPQPDQALGEATYQTPSLGHALKLDGPVLADVWLSTTAHEAPVTVRVFDVAPDGSVNELTDGWLSAGLRALDAGRSRYVQGQLLQPWHPFTQQSVLTVEPGTPYELAVEVFPTNALIEPGHSLRVAISSGDFPHQLAPLPALESSLAGTTTILTDPNHPSYVTLPAIGDTCTLGPASRGGGCRALPAPKLGAG